MNYLGLLLLTPLIWGLSYGAATIFLEGDSLNTFTRKAIVGLIMVSAFWGIIILVQ